MLLLWKSKGYRFSSVKRDKRICKKQWDPRTVIIHGQTGLDISTYNAFTTRFSVKNQKLSADKYRDIKENHFFIDALVAVFPANDIGR